MNKQSLPQPFVTAFEKETRVRAPGSWSQDLFVLVLRAAIRTIIAFLAATFLLVTARCWFTAVDAAYKSCANADTDAICWCFTTVMFVIFLILSFKRLMKEHRKFTKYAIGTLQVMEIVRPDKPFVDISTGVTYNTALRVRNMLEETANRLGFLLRTFENDPNFRASPGKTKEQNELFVALHGAHDTYHRQLGRIIDFCRSHNVYFPLSSYIFDSFIHPIQK